MKATAQWKEDMTFLGIADSGILVPLDAHRSFGGTGQGIQPMEMVALGLAGCTGMDVLSILRKKRQQITAFEVRVNAPRTSEPPQVFTSALLTYVVTGKSVDETAVVRSIELSMTKYCPVQVMLSQAVPMELHYEIHEQGPDGTSRLAVRGIWQPLSTL